MTRRPWFWPAFVVGILALGVGVNVVLLVVAHSDPSFAVEEDYYDKALRWDEHRAQLAANEALGWTFEFAALPAFDEDRGTGVMELTVAVRDAAGAGLDGATVRLETFPLARSGSVDRAALIDRGEGLYRGTVPLRRPGIWEFRFEVVAGDDRFTFREQREVGSPWPRS